MTTTGTILQLMETVDRTVALLRTRSLDMSFNEIRNIHGDGDLLIRPEYQRLFRWDTGKESRFIESLLLEMPIPPIYVVEDTEGRFELVDGLQRISSYLHFRGELDASHRGISKGDALKLTGCDILPQLNGLTFVDLPTFLEIKLKRHTVPVNVIRSDSAPRLRYDFFKRLNTGGENLTDQELRNATIRMMDSKFIDFIAQLAADESFLECTAAITDDKKNQLYLHELALRFFAFKNDRSRYVHEVGPFITEFMERVVTGGIAFDYAEEEKTFRATFNILSKALGPSAFARLGKAGYISSFSVYHFESISLGIQGILKRVDWNETQIEALKIGLTEIKAESEFIEITTGGGKNFLPQLDRRIEYVAGGLERRFATSAVVGKPGS